MHARRATFWHAAAPRATRATRISLFGRLLTVTWATCVVVGLVLMANFGYGMWKGVSDQQHLNQVWRHQVWQLYHLGPTRPAPKVVDSSLKRPVDGDDSAIWIPTLRHAPANSGGVAHCVV